MGKLTVSYNNENIINTTDNGSFTLATEGKLMTNDVDIVFEGGGAPYDGTVLVAGATVYTSARSGVTYINGIDNISPSELNKIAMAISNNTNITNSTQTIYVDYYDGYNEANYKVEVGNTVSFNVDDNEYDFRIIGFNHDDLTTATAYGKATATGKAGITFQMVDCLDTKYQMNSDATAVSNWDACELRTTHLPILKNTIDYAWSDIMKKVNKKTSAGSQSSTISTVSDDLFLLSEIEIFGSTTYSFAGEGDVYAYWSANNTASARIKNRDGSAYPWWQRSPRNGGSAQFCFVNASGNAAANNASVSGGVSFGFCV